MLIDRTDQYLDSLMSRFACPLLNGRTVNMAECVKNATEHRRQECLLANCASPWKLCPDCLTQEEVIDPQINRIDCFVFDQARCDFHERHGSKANRNKLFAQSVKNLPQPDRLVIEQEYYQLTEIGEWERIPEWHAAMYNLPLPVVVKTLPKPNNEMALGSIVSIEIKTVPNILLGPEERLELQRQFFRDAANRRRLLAGKPLRKKIDVETQAALEPGQEIELLSAVLVVEPIEVAVEKLDEIDDELTIEQKFELAISDPTSFVDIELARIMQSIKNSYGLTHKQLANYFGWESASWAGNRLALLRLNPRVQAQMEASVPMAERITCSEAVKHLMSLPENKQWYEARRIIKSRIF